MSMTQRREPRERSDRPANRQPHTPSNTNHHGHQPPPLDNNPSIWATEGSLAAHTHERLVTKRCHLVLGHGFRMVMVLVIFASMRGSTSGAPEER